MQWCDEGCHRHCFPPQPFLLATSTVEWQLVDVHQGNDVSECLCVGVFGNCLTPVNIKVMDYLTSPNGSEPMLLPLEGEFFIDTRQYFNLLFFTIFLIHFVIIISMAVTLNTIVYVSMYSVAMLAVLGQVILFTNSLYSTAKGTHDRLIFTGIN